MRKLLIAVLLLSVLLALPLLAMRSERALIAISHWAVETFTDYRLNLVHPVLRPFERNVAAAEIHLYPKADDAPPFLTVLDFNGKVIDSEKGGMLPPLPRSTHISSWSNTPPFPL